MPRLIALKKISSRYPVGAEFETSERNARLLKAIGKAEDAPTTPLADPERDALRAEAEKLGVEVDGRWGPARLREAIAAASPPPPERQVPRFYRRRDMVAEEE